MSVYSKYCVMCNKQFLTLRISTLFCSKKCANRSRGLPIKLKEQLIKRNTEFMLTRAVHLGLDIDIHEREVLERRSEEAPVVRDNSSNEEALLWAHARELKRKRAHGQEIPIITTKGAPKESPIVDPEMVDFKYDDDEIKGTISPIGVKLDENSTGFGSHVLDDEMAAQIHHVKEHEIPTLNIEEKEEQPQPQQGGLRKFGSLKGVKQ